MRTPHGRNLTYSLVESLGQSIVTGEYDAKPFPTEADLSKHYKFSLELLSDFTEVNAGRLEARWCRAYADTSSAWSHR